MADPVAANLALIRDRIEAAAGDPAAITLIAVTKGFGAAEVAEAVEAGLCDLGENYAQEFEAKYPVAPEVRWHFLGPVQRNKIRKLAGRVALWHSVDRIEEGEAIARANPGAGVLVQVNAARTPGQAGVPPSEVDVLVGRLQGLALDVRGLMVVGAVDDEERTRDAFGVTASLRARLGLRELSMGMTDDLDAAVAAGTTMIRVGRALFGPRPQVPEARR